MKHISCKHVVRSFMSHISCKKFYDIYISCKHVVNMLSPVFLFELFEKPRAS